MNIDSIPVCLGCLSGLLVQPGSDDVLVRRPAINAARLHLFVTGCLSGLSGQPGSDDVLVKKPAMNIA